MKKTKDIIVRRIYTPEEKFKIVQEALTPGVNVSAIAKKYEMSAPLLFNWRKKYGSLGSATKTVAISGSCTESGMSQTLNFETDRIRILEDELRKTKDELYRVKSFLGGKVFEMEMRNAQI